MKLARSSHAAVSPRRRKQRGQNMVEFSLVGIPLMFLLISIFEVSRGMWNYHTLAYAAKAGVRFAVVHGADCYNQGNSSVYNNCLVSVAQIATQIQNAGVGLVPATTQVTFTSHAGSTSCYLGTPVSGTACSTLSTTWPPNDNISNTVGQSITIKIQTPFNSAIALFWPGAKIVSFGSVIMYAQSQDNIRF